MTSAGDRRASRPLVIAYLHGATLSPPSMYPIARSMAANFPHARHVFLSLPGHGSAENRLIPSFDLESLVEDALEGLRAQVEDLSEVRLALVGESTGALILARLSHRLKQPPALMVLGEPPMTNGETMVEVRQELVQSSKEAFVRLREDLFGFHDQSQRNFHNHFLSLPCTTVLAYGLLRTSGEGFITSIIRADDIEQLHDAPRLITIGFQGRGHRVLQSQASHLASMVKGMMLGDPELVANHSLLLKPQVPF